MLLTASGLVGSLLRVFSHVARCEISPVFIVVSQHSGWLTMVNAHNVEVSEVRRFEEVRREIEQGWLVIEEDV